MYHKIIRRFLVLCEYATPVSVTSAKKNCLLIYDKMHCKRHTSFGTFCEAASNNVSVIVKYNYFNC